MEIQQQRDGDRLCVSLEGRLDTNTAPPFQDTIAPEIPGIRTLDIDISGLDYISSAGLRALLFLHKSCTKEGAQMKILGCSPVIMDIFKMTGFDKVLKFG